MPIYPTAVCYRRGGIGSRDTWTSWCIALSTAVPLGSISCSYKAWGHLSSDHPTPVLCVSVGSARTINILRELPIRANNVVPDQCRRKNAVLNMSSHCQTRLQTRLQSEGAAVDASHHHCNNHKGVGQNKTDSGMRSSSSWIERAADSHAHCSDSLQR